MTHKFRYNTLTSVFALLFSLLSSTTWAESKTRVYIISPEEGAVVTSPVTIQFGLQGMGVAPAGVERVNTGHHHLLVNQDSLPPLDQPLGAEALHFGGGQTQTTLELEPGTHTLQLILGDHLHRPHNPPVISEKITITVEALPLGGLPIKNLRQVSTHMYASGQPSPEQLRLLAKNGIKNIINLRNPDELSWDEAAVARELGINYHLLPINGASDITMENAEALATLIEGLSGEKTLVHCASSNRVGALVALQRGINGSTIDDAIVEGKRWGLTRLEPIVRERLENCEFC